MADEKTNREADRKVATGGANQTDDDVDPYTLMPGVVGRGSTVLPNSGRDDESSAARAEGTIGAAGEMDLTGRPAGTGGAAGMSGGSAAGASQGGGPGGGAASSGGAGPRAADAGPQSAESTLAALGDRELSNAPDAAGIGGAGGASGTGGEGGSDAAPDSALTGSPKNR